VYPFLPGIALAAGMVPPLVIEWANRHSGRFAEALERLWPRKRGDALNRPVRAVLTAFAVVAIALAVITPITGGVWLRIGRTTIFRNATVSRPVVVAAILSIVLGWMQAAPWIPVAALLLVAMPFDAYRNVRFLETREPKVEGAPMRTLRGCLVRLEQTGTPRGVYVHTQGNYQWRYPYYLRDAGWSTEEADDDRKLHDRLFLGGQVRPVFMLESDYQRIRQATTTSEADARRLTAMRRLLFDDNRLLLLPDAYAACADISGAGTQVLGER
jgi:hypothetical protein